MLRPRHEIEELPPAVHGGPDYAELQKLGVSPGDVLDLSVSTNPCGSPPGIQEAICRADFASYPDSESGELCNALAANLKIDPDHIIIGSGSTEIIRMIAQSYFGPGDSVLIPHPTYGDYETACRIAGAAIVKVSTLKEPDFRLNVSSAIDQMLKRRARGIFICNPNNPTGQYLNRAEVKKLVAAAVDSLIVLDEAYIAFTRNSWPSIELLNGGNLAIVRSMTKDYALAGVRLGYAIAPPHIISTLKKVRPPWNVSAAAQQAGLAALSSGSYLEDCRRLVNESKDFLITHLHNLGLKPAPSETNFFLVKVGDATGARNFLLSKGFLVRDCTSFGLPEYIRIAPRLLPDCKKLVSAIEEYLDEG